MYISSLGYIEKHNIFVKTAVSNVWATFGKFRLLLFHHLVTLVLRHSSLEEILKRSPFELEFVSISSK